MVDNINSLPLELQDSTVVEPLEDNDQTLSSRGNENEAVNLFQRDILVFDKDETLIHIISNDEYNDDVYKRQINKEWSFSFTVDIALADVIIRKNKVGVYDREGRLQLFIIEDITERYSKTMQMDIYCIHDSFILNDTVLEEFRVTDSINNILDSVLANTTYKRGYTDKFDIAEVDMQLTSRFGGLQTIAEAFGGELDFRFTLDGTKTKILNRYVDVKFSLGRDSGVRFTFDTNLTEVVRTVSSDNHFTVLYGLGRSLATGGKNPDGSKEYKRVNFSEVTWNKSAGDEADKPAGQRYIEDIEGIKKWGRIEGIYVNETITDPETLIKRTWKQLQKCKEPAFSYTVTVEDLSKLAGYEHLNVGIGDTVIIKDEDSKLELVARIQEEQYSIKENVIKVLDAESVPPSARAISGLSTGKSGNKRLVLGVLQRDFTEDSNSGIVSPPTVDSGNTDVNVDNESFPDILPAVPIISGTGLFSTIMTSWTYESSVYYGYELHGSQIENFIATKNTILARGDISSHLHQCKPGERWYFKVRAYNTHNNYTNFSNEVMLESAKVADGTEWFENAAIGDALIGELRLDRGWVGQLTGQHIDARELTVTDGNGTETLKIDSFGRVHGNFSKLHIAVDGNSNVPTKDEVANAIEESQDIIDTKIDQKIEESIDGVQEEIDKINEITTSMDMQIADVTTANNNTLDYINLITSDNYVTDRERSAIKQVGDEIVHQYNTMIHTLEAFNTEYLNAYQADLKARYDDLHESLTHIVNGATDGLIEFRAKLTLYYNAYHNCLYAISNFTKDELIGLRAEIKAEAGKIEMTLTQTDKELTTIKQHMSFTPQGWLELHGSINGTPSSFKTQLSDTKLSFWDNGQEVAYVSNKKLNIENAEIQRTLKVGDYIMTKSASGGIVFRKEN